MSTHHLAGQKMSHLRNPENLPWVEKYRPVLLNDLISHKDIISTITKFVDEGRLPHLLFYGPPGTGKTSTILACARQLYTVPEFASMVLELNASDDRGIDVVRQQIMNFASTKTIFSPSPVGGATGGKHVKLIILDEADAMTRDAQNALRRIIEKFTENVRFCLICNYLSKIIPAIQSRCTRFRFAPLSMEQMIPRVKHVIDRENVTATDDGVKALVTLAQGDMRQALNVLQSAAMGHAVVDEDAVYTCVGHPLKEDINTIVDCLMNKPFREAYQKISALKLEKGLALQDILTDVRPYIHRMDLPAQIQILLLEKMSDIEYRLSSTANERIQLSGLIAGFQMARAMIEKEARRQTNGHGDQFEDMEVA